MVRLQLIFTLLFVPFYTLEIRVSMTFIIRKYHKAITILGKENRNRTFRIKEQNADDCGLP